MDEYPKLLYKGAGTLDYVSVANHDAEISAREAGYGEYVSEYAPVQPTAADLDAVAAEQKAAEATQGDDNAIRS